MHVPFVDLQAQYHSIKKKIDAAIGEVITDSTYIGGRKVLEFEEQFGEYVGVNYAVGCANGTDAIEIALEALGIGQGDDVLVPAYTWVSTGSAVRRVGANPVFVDIHPDFYTIDPILLEASITAQTKAIIAVHFYGLPADMAAIMAIAKKHKLAVVEDCAQAHGAMIGKQMVGTFGDVATFSFYPGKNLGAYGDGGMILTNNKGIARQCQAITSLGQEGKHNHVKIGRNSRLDSMQAAILSVKLPMLEEWTARRRWVARQYNMQLDDTGVKIQRIPTDYKHVYHLYVVQVERRDELQRFLADNDIQTQIHYPKPLNQLKIFKDNGNKKVADEMSKRILSLPMYPEMTVEQISHVVTMIKKFLRQF